MLQTGFEDVEDAKLFGLPYVTTRKPLPFDTTLLNYNWQIWETKAFSIYAGQTNYVENASSAQTIDAILRFLQKVGVTSFKFRNAGYESIILDEGDLINVTARRAGIFYRLVGASATVEEGQALAKILDPYDASILDTVKAPVSGTVFFAHNKPLVLEHAMIYRIQEN